MCSNFEKKKTRLSAGVLGGALVLLGLLLPEYTAYASTSPSATAPTSPGFTGPPTASMRASLNAPASDSISCDYNDNIQSPYTGDYWAEAPNYLITVRTVSRNMTPGALQNFALCHDLTQHAWAFWSSHDGYWVTDEIGYSGAQKYQFYVPSPTVGGDQLFHLNCVVAFGSGNQWSITSTQNSYLATTQSAGLSIKANQTYDGSLDQVFENFNFPSGTDSPTADCLSSGAIPN